MELKQKLISEYKYKTELHAHSNPASGCSEVSPEELVEIYAGLGYDALVLTNHFIYDQLSELPPKEAVAKYMNDFYEAEKAGKKHGINIILGAELRFTENTNDYLFYGVNSDMLLEILPLLTGGLENFRKNYSAKDSAFIQAHPCRDRMTTVDPKLLDGMETFNVHPGHNGRVGMAQRLAVAANVGIKIAGTDFHHPNKNHEGLAAMRTKVIPQDSFEVARILKSGEYILEIGDGAIILP